MADESGTVRSISWKDLCPWLIITHVFRVAVSFPTLILALAGVVLMSLGWHFFSFCLLSEKSAEDPNFQPIVQKLETWPNHRMEQVDFFNLPEMTSDEVIEVILSTTLTTVFVSVAEPFRASFDPDLTWDKWIFLIAGAIWNVGVWAFFGLAIVRMGVVKLAGYEQVLLRESVWFATKKWLSCFSAPLLPYAGILVLALPMIFTGWIMRMDIGVLFSGLIWLVIILLSIPLAVLSIGLFVAWPLMWGSIAAEGGDSFDAISRSYSYTFQRPLQYGIYIILALLLGFLSTVVVYSVIELAMQIGIWFTQWGTGPDRWQILERALKSIRNPQTNGGEGISNSVYFGCYIISFLHSVLHSFLSAFVFAYFWISTAAIYLLLRQDNDQTELDDIYFSEEETTADGLPHLEFDNAGVPRVPDP